MLEDEFDNESKEWVLPLVGRVVHGESFYIIREVSYIENHSNFNLYNYNDEDVSVKLISTSSGKDYDEIYSEGFTSKKHEEIVKKCNEIFFFIARINNRSYEFIENVLNQKEALPVSEEGVQFGYSILDNQLKCFKYFNKTFIKSLPKTS